MFAFHNRFSSSRIHFCKNSMHRKNINLDMKMFLVEIGIPFHNRTFSYSEKDGNRTILCFVS